jgi:molybdate transport system substrate-binding protein
VVIGNPASGSIGRETQKILEVKGIYDQVMANARRLTTDSKDLIQVLRDKEADLVINWYATATWPENKSYVEALPIDARYAKPKKLVLGRLKYTRYPEISNAFMALAASAEGKSIFRKYGLYHAE